MRQMLTPKFGWFELEKIADRFYPKVDRNGPIPPHRPDLGPCHVWTGSTAGGTGRGKIKIRGVDFIAYRVAFLLTHGRWPKVCALHKCDGGEIGCVRADHLFDGTHADNTADMFAKGRARPVGAPGESHPKARLTEPLILEVRAALASGETQRSIAARLHVGKSTIGAVAVGQTWRCMGLSDAPRRRKARASKAPVASSSTNKTREYV